MNTETIAQALTARGYGIAVLLNLRSNSYMVVRYAGSRVATVGGRYVVISSHATEVAARKRANSEWAADRQAVAA